MCGVSKIGGQKVFFSSDKNPSLITTQLRAKCFLMMEGGGRREIPNPTKSLTFASGNEKKNVLMLKLLENFEYKILNFSS